MLEAPSLPNRSAFQIRYGSSNLFVPTEQLTDEVGLGPCCSTWRLIKILGSRPGGLLKSRCRRLWRVLFTSLPASRPLSQFQNFDFVNERISDPFSTPEHLPGIHAELIGLTDFLGLGYAHNFLLYSCCRKHASLLIWAST